MLASGPGARSPHQIWLPGPDLETAPRQPLGLFPSRGAPTFFLPGGPKAPGPADDAPDSSSGASSPSREAGGLDMIYRCLGKAMGGERASYLNAPSTLCVWYFVVYSVQLAKLFT